MVLCIRPNLIHWSTLTYIRWDIQLECARGGEAGGGEERPREGRREAGGEEERPGEGRRGRGRGGEAGGGEEMLGEGRRGRVRGGEAGGGRQSCRACSYMYTYIEPISHVHVCVIEICRSDTCRLF